MRRRTPVVAAMLAGLAAIGAVPPALGPGLGVPVAGAPPVAGHPWYLALGDSITAGYSVDPAGRGTNDSWALQLQPLLAATGRDWSLYDLACSNETTTTFRSGCDFPWRPPALRSASQHDAALEAIRGHRADLRLILIDLGINDLGRAAHAGLRAPEATSAAAALVANLRGIIRELTDAAPGVPVVMATLYDPLALADPGTVPFVRDANRRILALGGELHLAVADFASAINGDDGRSELLCLWVDCAHGDIHPTVAGHARLAATALAVIPR